MPSSVSLSYLPTLSPWIGKLPVAFRHAAAPPGSSLVHASWLGRQVNRQPVAYHRREPQLLTHPSTPDSSITLRALHQRCVPSPHCHAGLTSSRPRSPFKIPPWCVRVLICPHQCIWFRLPLHFLGAVGAIVQVGLPFGVYTRSSSWTTPFPPQLAFYLFTSNPLPTNYNTALAPGGYRNATHHSLDLCHSGSRMACGADDKISPIRAQLIPETITNSFHCLDFPMHDLPPRLCWTIHR